MRGNDWLYMQCWLTHLNELFTSFANQSVMDSCSFVCDQGPDRKPTGQPSAAQKRANSRTFWGRRSNSQGSQNPAGDSNAASQTAVGESNPASERSDQSDCPAEGSILSRVKGVFKKD